MTCSTPCKGTGTTFSTSAETNKSQEAQEEQANELLNQTQNASQLSSSQVKLLIYCTIRKLFYSIKHIFETYELVLGSD